MTCGSCDDIAVEATSRFDIAAKVSLPTTSRVSLYATSRVSLQTMSCIDIPPSESANVSIGDRLGSTETDNARSPSCFDITVDDVRLPSLFDITVNMSVPTTSRCVAVATTHSTDAISEKRRQHAERPATLFFLLLLPGSGQSSQANNHTAQQGRLILEVVHHSFRVLLLA